MDCRQVDDNPSDPAVTVRETVALATHRHEPDPERFKPFAYLTAPNATLYRQVMLTFVAAKRRFVVHMRSEDLVEALAKEGPTDEKAIADALAKLEEWGNLRADPDTSRVTGVEDFYRARFLYQLTHAGEAAAAVLVTRWERIVRDGPGAARRGCGRRGGAAGLAG